MHLPMKEAVMTKSDSQLRMDVESELERDASVDAVNIGVAVKHGVVTLSGHLKSFAEKYAAEHAAQRVTGVKGLAVELDVRLGSTAKRTDADIAAAAESSLRWHALVPQDRIKVMVEKGWITLSGEVDWDYQREHAMKAVRPLIGVVGVINKLSVKPRVTPASIKQRIQGAPWPVRLRAPSPLAG
jgi:osmotically-inducible protein OsmY